MHTLLSILALGLLIAFHELGHLLAARIFRVRVLRYAIGFGPPLVSFKRGHTLYTLGAIPLGGSVQLYGINPHKDDFTPGAPETFLSLAAWKRLVIIGAGSLANYLLALMVLTGLYVAGTHVPVPMAIGTVEPASPAAFAQLRPGDVIATVDGAPLKRWTDLVNAIAEAPSKVVRLEVRREGESHVVQVQPRPDERGRGRIGVTQQYVFRTHGVLEASRLAVGHAHTLVQEGALSFYRLLEGKAGIPLFNPGGMLRQASEAATSGIDSFLRGMVSISLALALFYLLPFPALDGGRFLFTLFETLTRRKVNPKLETLLHSFGFFALIALIFFVASANVRDILKVREEARARPPQESAQPVDAGVPGP